MDNLITFSIKVSVCMLVLYGFYAIALKKETYFSFNRVYLLLSLIISSALPFLNISLNTGNAETRFASMLQTVKVSSDNVFITDSGMSFPHYIALIYFIGFVFFAARFIIKFISLYLIKRKCSIVKEDGHSIALCKKPIASFSFFNTVYIDENMRTEEHLDKIIMHETVHIKQLHSIDILLAEIFCIFTWFNPISWMLKAALKETHEYLADSWVSGQTHDSSEYFLLLIKNTIGIQPDLANNFNKSLTLKRLNMMKKNRSGRLSRLKALLVLPFVVVLFMAFSCKNNTEDVNLQSSTVTQNSGKADKTIDKMPEYPGGQAAMTKFIIDNVKYPEAAKTAGIQGKVFVTFTVTKTGKLDKISVTQKVNDLLDAEAIRVISLMPDWIPGEDKGVKVDCEMTLPINFKLA